MACGEQRRQSTRGDPDWADASRSELEFALMGGLGENVVAALANVVAADGIDIGSLTAKLDRRTSHTRFEMALPGWAGQIEIGNLDDARFRLGGNGRSDEQAGADSCQSKNGELGHVASPLKGPKISGATDHLYPEIGFHKQRFRVTVLHICRMR
jgi:hypothetical protein